MKVAKISKKLIKPHTPTPPNLRNYYLSFIDHRMSSTKFSVVLFYQSKPENNLQLEESLAKILVQFYPLAGRYIKNDHFIDCSDQGAIFVEAEALDVELTTTDLVTKDLFPDQDSPSHAPNPLLSIQVTHFPSGGLAIAIDVSHAFFDAWSLGKFVAAWSNATNPDGKIMFTPCFDLPSLIPYKDRDFTRSNRDFTRNNRDHLSSEDKNIVAKRFLFDKVALARLRSILSPNSNGKTISRVLVVCAVIAKTLIGLDRVKHGKTRDFVISQAINMRERTITPQPKHACGNLIILSLTRCVAASEGEEIGMQELVDLIGDAVGKSIADNAEILCPDGDGYDIVFKTGENFKQLLMNSDMNTIVFSDWSKFGFYEADFGWGRPISVSIGPPPFTNLAVLMSNKEGDGIEAWVCLNQDDMHYFEHDDEINYFTT